jgi:PAS domain S-box-containing protein
MTGKILIIDDEATIRFTLESFLVNKGHDVSVAADSQEALTLIGNSNFDLIISDIVLDELSGIDILTEIRKRDLACPVVMITGAPDMETAQEALRLGAYDYLPKPVTKESLLSVTSKALEKKALYDEKEKYRLNLENVFRNIDYGIITIDQEGVVIDFNDTARRLCGYSGELKGKTFWTSEAACNGACVTMLKESLTTGKQVELYRHECSHKDKPAMIVTISASPLTDHGGNPSGAMMVIKDETRIDSLERDLRERRKYHRIIGKSDKMQKVFSLIQSLASVYTTVLITGESGTGKELAAEALHIKGVRRDKPLIKVNCSALQENLLESELFGHVKGAFTGATENKEGRFYKANGGTIFLDEIGDISARIQVKLLRVIQEREFERVGDSKPVKIDVRIVAATNKDLREKIRSGEFREDLYYRLKVVEVQMPPLRENRDDIPLLVDHFLSHFNSRFHKNIEGISAEVMQLFMQYRWPGNVRELEHTMEHAFIICNNSLITSDHLPPDIVSPHPDVVLASGAGEEEDLHSVLQALDKSRWNITKAARMLGVSRPTLYKKMKNLDLRDS